MEKLMKSAKRRTRPSRTPSTNQGNGLTTSNPIYTTEEFSLVAPLASLTLTFGLWEFWPVDRAQP